MKKIIFFIATLLFNSIVLAYSNALIPGGETLGLHIKNDGVLIVGYYKVNGEYINKFLEIGDKVTKVNGIDVEDVNAMVKLIDQNMENNEVKITYVHEGQEIENKLELSYFNGNYRTGLYVKSLIVGVGTLTYIDPNTQIFGMLGHVINESKTNSRIEVKTGTAFNTKVDNFTRSKNGNVGSKNATILENDIFGTIEKNTNYGVFGNTSKNLNKKTIEIATIDEVKNGKAYIQTTDQENNIQTYEIKILDIDKNNKEKNFYFEIIDDKLISMTGGIVQGMSGSPIIQDGKIIGAVTRVLVDDVKKGYGISIIKMLEEVEKLLKKN